MLNKYWLNEWANEYYPEYIQACSLSLHALDTKNCFTSLALHLLDTWVMKPKQEEQKPVKAGEATEAMF